MADDPEAKFEHDPTCSPEFNERGARTYAALQDMKAPALSPLGR